LLRELARRLKEYALTLDKGNDFRLVLREIRSSEVAGSNPAGAAKFARRIIFIGTVFVRRRLLLNRCYDFIARLDGFVARSSLKRR
jgi:hypothetical protein